MEAISICPLRVASLRWRPSRSTFALTVIVKATFSVAPVACSLAEEQEDANEHENHWDDDPGRSVYSPSDIVPFKPRPEVMLVGYAFAPRGEAVGRLAARLLVGSVDKTVVINADRVFSQDGALRGGPRFQQMPLRYERAAGGPGTANPVGVPRAQDTFGAVHLPNLEPPGLNVTRPDDFIEPVGFGPIAAGWPARRERLGRHAGSWSLDLLRTEPVPEPFDPLYFMAAPADQHLDELRANERIVLENLHPELPRLVTSLPGCYPRALVERPRAAPSEVALTCDTLWIDTARSISTLVWRGVVQLDAPDEEGRVVVTMESGAEPRTERAAERAGPEAPVFHRATTQPVLSARRAEPVKRWPNWLAQQGGDDEATATKSPAQILAESAKAPRVDTAAPVWLQQARAPMPSAPEIALRPPVVPEAPRFGGTPPPPPAPPAPPAPPMFALAQPPPPAPVDPGPSAWARPAPPAPSTDTKPPVVEAPKPPSSRDTPAKGAAAASDAAAAAAKAAAAPAERVQGGPAAQPPAREPAREHVDLLWFDAAELPRIRADKALGDPQPQRAGATWIKGERDTTARDQEAKDRRDVLAILTRTTPLDDPGLAEVAKAAYRDDGVFTAPLAVVGGELAVTFDEVEALRATLTVVQPFLGVDKKLRDAVTGATDILKSEWVVTGDVAEGLTRRVEEAFAQGQRAVAPGYLDAGVARMLLEGRRYQRKTLLGQKRIRALFTLPGGGAPIPTYLPDALAEKLPLFRRFRAKAVVELRPQEDQYETHADALIVLALGRVLNRAA